MLQAIQLELALLPISFTPTLPKPLDTAELVVTHLYFPVSLLLLLTLIFALPSQYSQLSMLFIFALPSNNSHNSHLCSPVSQLSSLLIASQLSMLLFIFASLSCYSNYYFPAVAIITFTLLSQSYQYSSSLFCLASSIETINMCCCSRCSSSSLLSSLTPHTFIYSIPYVVLSCSFLLPFSFSLLSHSAVTCSLSLVLV